MEKTAILTIGDRIELEIRKLGINGEGIGYHRQLTVFVPGAITKEVVDVEIVDVKPGFVLGKIVSVIAPSNRRIAPPCPFYDRCGGCQLQHVDYSEQLKHKQHLLKQSLKRYTSLPVESIPILKTMGMKEHYHYRNKSQMPFRNTNFGLALGLYEPNSNHFVAIDSCMVQSDIINQTNQLILNLCQSEKLLAYDSRNKEGILLNLVTRYLRPTNQLQVTFIVTKQHPALMRIALQAKKAIPNLVSVHYSINQPKSIAMFGKTIEKLIGSDYAETLFNQHRYQVSPDAFHQLNTEQMERLYHEIFKLIGLTGKEIVVDCFSGIGMTAIEMAAKAKMVYGIDYSEASIKSARNNAEINHAKNVQFIQDRVERVLPTIIEKKNTPDVIMFDPPRSGLDDSLIKTLKAAKIKKMIYVSCNPSTLAKNIAELSSLYDVSLIQPIDMFPHTASVESITLLTLK